MVLFGSVCRGASTLFPLGPDTGWNINDFVKIDNPSNSPTVNGKGSVSYIFYVSKSEVSNDQYAVFLNNVGQSTTSSSFLISNTSNFKITRSGSPGSYFYNVVTGFNASPVNGISPAAAMMYCNWLANFNDGRSTTSGSYNVDFNSQGSFSQRSVNASTFIMNQDETLKTMYYNLGSQAWSPNWSNPNNILNADVIPSEFVEHSKNGGYLIGDQVKYFYTTSSGGSPISLSNAETMLYPDFMTSSYNNMNWVGFTQNNFSDVGFRVATTLSNVPEPSVGAFLLFSCAVALALRKKA